MRSKANVIAAILLMMAALIVFRADFWLLPPAKKFARAVNADLPIVLRSPELKSLAAQIVEVNASAAPDVPVEWMQEHITDSITINKQGTYTLELFVIYWTESFRYGAVVNMEIIDKRTNNRVWESARTYKLGLVY